MQTEQKKWWYQETGLDAKHGPFTQQEIQRLINQGTVTRETMLWKEGMPDWVPAVTAMTKPPATTTKTPRSSLPELTTEDAAKWYNKKNRLWLSLLFWPLTVYGVYKTKLLDLKTKKIIAGVAGAMLILAFMNGDGNGDSVEVGMPGKPSWVSPFDHSVSSVERFIKKRANDEDSYESVNWMLPIKNANGTWRVEHTFRVSNFLGAKVIDTKIFIVSKDGSEVLGMY